MKKTFNLKNHSTIDDIGLLKLELNAFDIFKNADGYSVNIGDETVTASSLQEALSLIRQGIKEVKDHLFDSWMDLYQLSQRIFAATSHNSGSLNNLIFLNAVKKASNLSVNFSQLPQTFQAINKLLDLDISVVDDHLIKHFNAEYFTIQALHCLVMNELYRQNIVQKYLKITKQAQISGPWANLDLPIEERKWEWSDGEDEYFSNRVKSRRAQQRYNPENATESGFYYVWQDRNRDPYLWEDRAEESPYKSRNQLSIASKKDNLSIP